MRQYPLITQAVLDNQDLFRVPAFNDYYFSVNDPINERKVVFIEGNKLASRFQTLEPFQVIRIGETGFGTGLTFLLASLCFIKNAPKTARLQWVSAELFPLTGKDLDKILNRLPLTAELLQLAHQLINVWPQAIPTCHRRIFHHGQIILDLHFGDANTVFANLTGTIDAWCLDGFAPERNPELWNSKLFEIIAARSKSLATVSTYTAARTVQDGLASAGFDVKKVPGFGGKRERIQATYHGQPKRSPFAPNTPAIRPRSIVVIGAGLAGAWVANGLARRGYPVTVFDKLIPASGASGNTQGITYAKLSIESTPTSLIQMQALAGLTHWFSQMSDSTWHQTGVILVAKNATDEAHQRKLIKALPKSGSLIKPVSRSEASYLAGNLLRSGGLYIPQAGWLNPKACVETLLAHPLIQVHNYHEIKAVDSIESNHRVTIQTKNGRMQKHNFETLVWTNAIEAQLFLKMHVPLKAVRGQITKIKSHLKLKTSLCGDAYIAPGFNGFMTCGATYEPNSTDLDTRPDDNISNIKSANRLFSQPPFAPHDIIGQRVSIRTATPDYAPVVGQLAEPTSWADQLERLKDNAGFVPDRPLPFIRGQYILAGLGSRGTLTAPVTSELVISQMLGEVLPVSEQIRDALSPDRFFRRQLIRRLN